MALLIRVLIGVVIDKNFFLLANTQYMKISSTRLSRFLGEERHEKIETTEKLLVFEQN